MAVHDYSLFVVFLVSVSSVSLIFGESWAQTQSSSCSCHQHCIMGSINNKEITVMSFFFFFFWLLFLCNHFKFEGLGVEWSLSSLATGFFWRIMGLIYRLWQNTSGRVSFFFFFFFFQGWTILWSASYWHIINKHKAACLESRRSGVFECVWVCMCECMQVNFMSLR